MINNKIINNQRVSKLKHFPAGERPGAGQQGIEANILSFVSKVFYWQNYGSTLFVKYYIADFEGKHILYIICPKIGSWVMFQIQNMSG